MGYTHYFGLDENHKVSTRKLSRDITKVLRKHIDIIQYESDVKEPPICKVSKGEILVRFNGIGVEGHETFYFNSADKDFDEFCKTAEKDYDIVVCKVLLILKAFYGYAMSLHSDGFYGYQPKDKNYVIGDTVDFKDMDGNWGEVLSTSKDKFEFKVIGTHGDNDCYFKWRLKI